MSNLAVAALDLDQFLLDPGSSFRRPEDVIGDPRLRRRQKIEILCRWAYDATELAVAEEEGMNGGEASNLHGVLNALVSITAGSMQDIPGRPNMPVSAFTSGLSLIGPVRSVGIITM